MNNIGLTIAWAFFALIFIIFCTHFSSKLAQLKGRSKAWGFLGFVLNIIGLIIVCFLPSKRKDSMNTNPIIYLASKFSKLSRTTFYIGIGIVCAIILTVIAYDNIPKIIENRKYTKQVTEQTASDYIQPTVINGQAKSIFAGTNSSFVITQQDQVYCLGYQPAPQLADLETGIIYSNAKKVVENGKTCYVLDTSGNLYAIEQPKIQEDDKEQTIAGESQTDTEAETEAVTGAEDTSSPLAEFKLICKDVKDFSISETTLGVIKTDDKLYMSAIPDYSTQGLKLTTELTEITKNVQSVYCETTYTAILKQNGEVAVFGTNAYGQFGKEELQFSLPTVIAKDIKQVATGDDFMLLLNKNGEVSACGNNDCGQLGNGSNDKFTQFTTILSGIREIKASGKSSFAISDNNELYAWGYNYLGQLGLGNNSNTLVPTIAAQNVVDAATSGLHTVILNSEGKVLATGYNSHSQCGKNKALTKFNTLINIK